MYQQMKDIDQTSNNPWAVFLIFLRLGLTSFGGPVAHLSYFRDEFVLRRRWLSERSYADLVAFIALLFWKAPPWVVVIISGGVGHLIC